MRDELPIVLDTRDGNLHLTLTPAGKELIHERDEYRTDDWIVEDLLEQQLQNGWTFITADQIGALSEAPILSDSIHMEDDGSLSVDGPWWYFEPYQVRSILDDLKRKGRAVFTRGPEEEE